MVAPQHAVHTVDDMARGLALPRLRYWSLSGIALISGCMGIRRQMSETSGVQAVEGEHAVGAAGAGGVSLDEATACASCHSNASGAGAMRDSEGRGVAPYDLWRSSMMANAARDPLWLAAVSSEVANHPDKAAEIEATCGRCHAPMGVLASEQAEVLWRLQSLDGSDAVAALGGDGVSCVVCHQILPDNLGNEESFSGGFELNAAATIFGPHTEPFATPMLRFSGFEPAFGEHVNSPELCATCHTLTTTALRSESSDPPRVLEQAPYLEWKNSAFSGESGASCQDCHMPRADENGVPIVTRLARNPGGRDFPPLGEREPFGRHVFVGGNTLIPAILRDNAEELGVTAPTEAFDATLALVEQQLKENTIELGARSAWDANGLTVNVNLRNLTGHKFPTGHPARRAWLEFRVENAGGELQFSSGATNQTGVLVDETGQPLASERVGGPVQPHLDTIDFITGVPMQQVYILESVLCDARGDATYHLLDGAGYEKDNRLLPSGYDASSVNATRTAPVGVIGDRDFGPAEDTVRYRIPVSRDDGPFLISIVVWYQALSARYAAELFMAETEAVRRFERLYERADRRGVAVASLQLSSP